MSNHVHEWQIFGGLDANGEAHVGAACDCPLVPEVYLSKEEINRRLNATEWMYRMGNEDIAAELSATFDLNLEDTRKLADWILKNG